MAYILGIITGLVTATVVLGVELYLAAKGKTAVKELERAISKHLAPQGAVIEPKTDLELELEEQLRGKIERGEEITAEDVL